MPKIFIIERPRNNIDVSKAREYGDIIYIFNSQDRRPSAWEHVQFGRMALQRLKELNFDNETDFICIVGTMLIVSVVIIAVAQHHSIFNILLFNCVTSRYEQKRFSTIDWMV